MCFFWNTGVIYENKLPQSFKRPRPSRPRGSLHTCFGRSPGHIGDAVGIDLKAVIRRVHTVEEILHHLIW